MWGIDSDQATWRGAGGDGMKTTDGLSYGMEGEDEGVQGEGSGAEYVQ